MQGRAWQGIPTPWQCTSPMHLGRQTSHPLLMSCRVSRAPSTIARWQYGGETPQQDHTAVTPGRSTAVQAAAGSAVLLGWL